MAIYSEYLKALKGDVDALNKERKKQLARIASIRKRDVLVMAAEMEPRGPVPVGIDYSDLLPVTDQLSTLTGGGAMDLILETPGGSGEMAEQIVRLIRNRYPGGFAVIVPGAAMSAGTLIAMGADEILMGDASALGPIDAQLQQQGKSFSADALLKGFRRIQKEVTKAGTLNKAYIPMLQGISPGELEAARNALGMAKVLVADWLPKYKFKTWTTHKSTGAEVTPEERRQRASEIAKALCKHSRWKSHGRRFTIQDLSEMKLEITNYMLTPDLADAIQRYFTLLRMTLESSPVYKVFETPTSQIFRQQAPTIVGPVRAGPPLFPGLAGAASEKPIVELTCNQCGHQLRLQVDFGKPGPLLPGLLAWPEDDLLKCPGCGITHQVKGIREQLERQSGGQKIVRAKG